MSPRYQGRPWRSRFLRAPKVAVELASRDDFVPLKSLAELRLGLKTGRDAFFFVRPIESVSSSVRLGSSRARSVVHVKGLDGAWEGEISAADLRPAALNPHALDGSNGRLLCVPARPPVLYLYPQDRTPAAELSDYVEAGVREGVHEGNLVRSNAGSNGRWYRQARAMVASRWALPYNSAYDYGAWDNAYGAVLNGRFVGADPLENVDSDLLGAVLNSTFVAATRLLEGVSTGAEGAFDVGPPAARLMAVPDVRALSGSGERRVRDALAELRSSDLMPQTPDRNARVSPKRHELDLAVMEALRVGSGEAQYLVGKLYERYARWRGTVEDAEDRMQRYRRVMNAGGQNRSENPTILAARRIWDELAGATPLVPGSLLEPSEALEHVDVARNYKLPSQEPLVQPGLVPGAVGESVDLGSFARARYVAMLLEVGFAPPLAVPVDHGVAARVAESFEHAKTAFRDSVWSKAATYAASSSAKEEISRSAERLWMRDCRAYGMSV